MEPLDLNMSLGEEGAEPGGHHQEEVREWPLATIVVWGIAALAVWFLGYFQLKNLAGFLTYDLFGLARGSHLGEAVSFFLYDTPKVLMLLGLIVFAVGIIRSYFTAERTRAILAGKRESAGNVLAWSH